MSTLRRRPSERVMSVLWGAIVTAIAVLLLVSLSGHTVDLELALIVALAVVGVWLLLSATLSGRRSRARQKALDPESDSASEDAELTPTR